MSARTCEGCTLCCKVLGVRFENEQKPQGKWCTYCDPRAGCRIYPDRPKACSEFLCLWVMRDDALPDALKPSKSRVVVTAQDGIVYFQVDPQRPDAWQAGPVREVIERLTLNGGPAIVMNQGKVVFHNDSAARAVERIRRSLRTNNEGGGNAQAGHD